MKQVFGYTIKPRPLAQIPDGTYTLGKYQEKLSVPYPVP